MTTTEAKDILGVKSRCNVANLVSAGRIRILGRHGKALIIDPVSVQEELNRRLQIRECGQKFWKISDEKFATFYRASFEEGMSILEAAKKAGIGYQSGRRIWQQIRKFRIKKEDHPRVADLRNRGKL